MLSSEISFVYIFLASLEAKCKGGNARNFTIGLKAVLRFMDNSILGHFIGQFDPWSFHTSIELKSTPSPYFPHLSV